MSAKSKYYSKTLFQNQSYHIISIYLFIYPSIQSKFYNEYVIKLVLNNFYFIHDVIVKSANILILNVFIFVTGKKYIWKKFQ